MYVFRNIPKKWESKLIPDVLFFQEGPGVRKWQFTEHGVKLLNVGNINNQKINLNTTKVHISEHEAKGRYKHFLIDEGDLLIACSGIIVSNFHNKIAFAEKKHLPLCLNTSTMRFKPLDESIDLNYFRFYLQTRLFGKQLQKLITGSAQLNFGPSHIKKIKVLLPPLDQQKKIAAILDTADAYRQKTKALIEKYDELTQSLFLDMFGDPFTNIKGFLKVKVEEVCDELFLGLTSKVDYVDKGGFPLIRAKDINNGILSFKEAKYISESQHKKLTSRRITKRGDVLISKSGTLGTCAISNTDREFSTYESIFTVRPKKDKLSSVFLVYLVRSRGFQLKLLGNQVGGTVAHLNLKMFRDFDFPLPPLELQNQFAERVQAIENQKGKAEASLTQARDLFNSLLQRGFKGELT